MSLMKLLIMRCIFKTKTCPQICQWFRKKFFFLYICNCAHSIHEEIHPQQPNSGHCKSFVIWWVGQWGGGGCPTQVFCSIEPAIWKNGRFAEAKSTFRVGQMWAMVVQNMPLGSLASPRSFMYLPEKLNVCRKILCFHSFTFLYCAKTRVCQWPCILGILFNKSKASSLFCICIWIYMIFHIFLICICFAEYYLWVETSFSCSPSLIFTRWSKSFPTFRLLDKKHNLIESFTFVCYKLISVSYLHVLLKYI